MPLQTSASLSSSSFAKTKGSPSRILVELPAVERRSPAAQAEPLCLLEVLDDPIFEQNTLAAVFGEEKPEQPEWVEIADPSAAVSADPSGKGSSPNLHVGAAKAFFRRQSAVALGAAALGFGRMQASRSEGALPALSSVPKPSGDAKDRAANLGAVTAATAHSYFNASNERDELIVEGLENTLLGAILNAVDSRFEESGPQHASDAVAAMQKRKKDRKNSVEALARMLDDSLVPTAYEVQLAKRGPGMDEIRAQVQSLREALRRADVLDRVIDLFHKCDVDGNGEISLKEFTDTIKSILPETRIVDIHAIFSEFDESGDGSISYEELIITLRKKDTIATNAFVVKPLPKDLQPRRRDVLNLYKDIAQQKATKSGGGSVPWHDARLPSFEPSNFEEALRLYYPKDTRETRSRLIQWIEDVLKSREATLERNVAEADAAIIKQLDVDGSNTIDITEFCELSKRTGLSKTAMRARFRDKDFGNSGVLSIEQTREVLRELRAEQHLRTNKNEPLDLEFFAGLRAPGERVRTSNSSNEALV
jgi:Ca2+-binding EF-hand superfamily protein